MAWEGRNNLDLPNPGVAGRRIATDCEPPTAQCVNAEANGHTEGAVGSRAAGARVSRVLRGRPHSARSVSALLADASLDEHGQWVLPWTLEAAISRLEELDDRATAADVARRRPR